MPAHALIVRDELPPRAIKSVAQRHVGVFVTMVRVTFTAHRKEMPRNGEFDLHLKESTLLMSAMRSLEDNVAGRDLGTNSTELVELRYDALLKSVRGRERTKGNLQRMFHLHDSKPEADNSVSQVHH
jgi:hypothetical protein